MNDRQFIDCSTALAKTREALGTVSPDYSMWCRLFTMACESESVLVELHKRIQPDGMFR